MTPLPDPFTLEQILEPLAQFGLAGVMAGLWVRERMLTRQRDAQLTQTHERIMQENEHFQQLMKAMRANTRVIERFDTHQQQLAQTIERVHQALSHWPATPPTGYSRAHESPERAEPRSADPDLPHARLRLENDTGTHG